MDANKDTEREAIGQLGHGAVDLVLLLDILTAVGDQIAELPPPLGLFAAELEAGLAETLAGTGDVY